MSERMTNSNNNKAKPFLTNALGVAKKLKTLTSKDQHTSDPQVDDAKNNPQHLLRQHLPHVSEQLLGRHYAQVSRLSHFIAPEVTDKVSNYLFERLNQFSHQMSDVDDILNEAGAAELEELTQDIDRSKRISQALLEQNKWLASAQGAISGATGLIGSAIDIPASLVLALRTIYQVGHAYGFELSKEHEQAIVQYIFKQIDLGLIAEKQTILMAIKSLGSMKPTHDTKELQQFLEQYQHLEAFKKWLSTDAHQQGEKSSLLHRLSPIAGASVSAIYSWRLVEDVHQKAQTIFSQARDYLQNHQELGLSPIGAYEKSIERLKSLKEDLDNAYSNSIYPKNDVSAEKSVSLEDSLADENKKIDRNINNLQSSDVKDSASSVSLSKEKSPDDAAHKPRQFVVKNRIDEAILPDITKQNRD